MTACCPSSVTIHNDGDMFVCQDLAARRLHYDNDLVARCLYYENYLVARHVQHDSDSDG